MLTITSPKKAVMIKYLHGTFVINNIVKDVNIVMTYHQFPWVFTLNSPAKSSFKLKSSMTFWLKNHFLNIDSPLSLPRLKTKPLGAKSL